MLVLTESRVGLFVIGLRVRDFVRSLEGNGVGTLVGNTRGMLVDADVSNTSTVSTGDEVISEMVTGLPVGDWVGSVEGIILGSSDRLDDGGSVTALVGY